MIAEKTLTDLIQEKIFLSGENDRGFRTVKCAVCNDYQERGGFKFDGDSVGYSCWNCSERFRYEEGTGKFSRNCRSILEAFGITREELQQVSSSIFFNRGNKSDSEITVKSVTKLKLNTPEVALPERCFRIGHDDHLEIQLPLVQYLLDRKIDPFLYDFRFSLKSEYLRRVIIPFTRDGKIIYWQARAIDDDVKRRYLNCSMARDAVMYGYDELSRYDDAPLFITEGVFDAIPLNGVCLLGSTLNQSKFEILKRSRRRKIFVFDKDTSGGALGKTVIEHGWEITHVDDRVNDVNDSIIQLGLPYTIYSLIQNATTSVTQTEKKFSRLSLDMAILKSKLRKTNYA